MDDRMYFVFFALLLVILAIVIPFFLKAEQPNPCKKSLVLKQTCSTVFILNALIAGLIGDFTRYAALMFVGLCFSWLGDYLLHVRPGSGFFVAGLSSFLVAHVFYTIAYCKAFKVLFPDTPLVTAPELIIYIILVVAAILSAIFIVKIELGKLLIPCILYTATIAAMDLYESIQVKSKKSDKKMTCIVLYYDDEILIAINCRTSKIVKFDASKYLEEGSLKKLAEFVSPRRMM